MISFNYQPIITGAVHKWIGRNDVHDDISLYSFSWLMGGVASKGGLRFPNGGRFFVSSYDVDLLKRMIQGIQTDSTIGQGLNVKEVLIQEQPAFQQEETFFCASPVLIKRRDGESEKHYTFKDKESDDYLTETLQTKLIKAGLSGEGVSVRFDKTYHSPKTKVIYYKSIGNRVNLCPVIISGTPEQLSFAWNVGVGNSTGIGFGALK